MTGNVHKKTHNYVTNAALVSDLPDLVLSSRLHSLIVLLLVLHPGRQHRAVRLPRHTPAPLITRWRMRGFSEQMGGLLARPLPMKSSILGAHQTHVRFSSNMSAGDRKSVV